jgi:hypothetical protein
MPMIDLHTATAATFQPFIAQPASLQTSQGERVVTLTDVVIANTPSLRAGGGFALYLIVEGAQLQQAIYTVSWATQSVELFIVPIAKAATGFQYEAVFN